MALPILQPYGAYQDIFTVKSRWGAAYLWVAPPLNSDGRITLAREGNDIDSVLPPYIPRTAYGGKFLGYDIGGIIEKPVVSYDKVPVFGSTIPRTVRVKEEQTDVTTKLAFNNDVGIRMFFFPTGNFDSMGFSYGGSTYVNLWPLLVILINENDPETIECHYYHAGYFEPSQMVSGQLFSPIDMVYHTVAGTVISGDSVCLLPAGRRTMVGWWVKVDFDGNNINIDPYGNEIVPTPAPYYNFIMHNWIGFK